MDTVTEFIGEDYRKWCKRNSLQESHGDRWTDNVVFISAPTGTGKTTFILHTFLDYVVREGLGRILILVPRKILLNQMERILLNYFAEKHDMEKYQSCVRVMTYQSLEKNILEGRHIGDFYAVICDEAHYFVEDSVFNSHVQVSFEWLCEYISEKRRLVICQSATLELFQKTIIQELNLSSVDMAVGKRGKGNKLQVTVVRKGEYYGRFYEYKMCRDTADSDIAVGYLENDNERNDILCHAHGKRLCFVSNKESGNELLRVLGDNNVKASFIMAENKETEAEEEVSSLVCDSRFASDVLIATSVLDVGVNILDPRVSAIVLDSCERTTFLQMLGRVRLLGKQELTVYVFKRNARYFKNWRESAIQRLQFQHELMKVPEEYRAAWLVKRILHDKMYIDRCAVICSEGGLRYNHLIQSKLSNLLLEFNDVIEGLEKDSDYFIKKQLAWLGMEDSFSIHNYASNEIKKQKRKEVISVISEKCGISSKKPYSFEEVSQELQKIKDDVRKLDHRYLRSNERLSVDRFRKICQSEQLPFAIVQKEVERKQMYWFCSLDVDDNGKHRD